MPVDTSQLDAVIAKINRKYEDTIRRGNQQAKVTFLSTGSPELDVAMGGGVPLHHWTRFYGGYGSTKTMTALRVIAAAQRAGLTCVFFNVEKRYDAEFAAERGIDTKKLILVNGSSIEEITDKMEALFTVAHLFVIDSCSMAVSEDELNADVRDWRPGIAARSWGKAFRRLNERFDMEQNTVILIDQVRVDFRTGGENPVGGKVFDHQSSMSVLFRKAKWLYRDEEGILSETAKQRKGSDGQTVPDGAQIKIRIEKSSVCRPFRTATLHYDLDNLKYDVMYELTKAAKHYNIVRTRGAYYDYVDDEGETTTLHGEKQLRKFISDNEDIQEFIRESAIEAATLRDLADGDT
jgi:recombination protein RecA